MIATYFVRLAILCFASFFLIHLALGLLSLSLVPRCARLSASMPAEWGSSRFIMLRLAPVCLSILAISIICIPSYLRYEANSATEDIGSLSLVLACLGLLVCVTALVRAVRALIQSSSLSKNICDAKDSNSWYLNRGAEELPSMGLVGLLNPRVVVSLRIFEMLTTEQFQAALEHERAHRSAGDNLKRLLILFAPELFPFVRTFKAMEDYWDKYAELSADDFAARGEPSRSIALAEALIKFARLEGSQLTPPLVSGLFAAREGLTFRVERLLDLNPVAEPPACFRTVFWVGPCLLLATPVLLLAQPQLLHGVYHLLESLLR